MKRYAIARTLIALALLTATLMVGVIPAAADGIDPPIKEKWGYFSGRWPVTVEITDCKRLNLRTTPSLSGNWNIAAYPPRGTTMTATGRVEDFIQVLWNGRTLYGYAAYLKPINDVPIVTQQPPVVVQPPVIVKPPVVVQPPVYYYPPTYQNPDQTWPQQPVYPTYPYRPYNPWWNRNPDRENRPKHY
ncbi:MAG: hypothetical protein LBS11_02315 [Oscillospiraceae bacterium]|jgi:hypothetical protein|nr:hypothetical protein [Oscillospiraceae bacterium]